MVRDEQKRRKNDILKTPKYRKKRKNGRPIDLYNFTGFILR